MHEYCLGCEWDLDKAFELYKKAAEGGVDVEFIFTPTDTTNYNTVEDTVKVNVVTQKMIDVQQALTDTGDHSGGKMTALLVTTILSGLAVIALLIKRRKSHAE